MVRFSLSLHEDNDDASDTEDEKITVKIRGLTNNNAPKQLQQSSPLQTPVPPTEPPHPIGFSPPHWGRTWFSVEPPSSSDGVGKCRYSLDDNFSYSDDSDDSSSVSTVDDNELAMSNIEYGDIMHNMQSYPPLSSFVDARTASTKSLVKYYPTDTASFPEHHQSQQQRDDRESQMDLDLERLAHLLSKTSIQQQQQKQQSRPPLNLSDVPTHEQRQYEIQQRMQKEKLRLRQEQQNAEQKLQYLLQKAEKEAAAILRQQQQQHEDMLKRKAAAEQQQEEEQQRLIQQAAAAAEQQEQQQSPKEETSQNNAATSSPVPSKTSATASPRESSNTSSTASGSTSGGRSTAEHVVKAKKLVDQLVQLRQSIEPFETSKAVSKRRLQMKKIVRGKMNILNEDAAKVRFVAEEIAVAIADARALDDEIKQQIKNQQPNVTPEMARGKRYLIDLLASNAITRVQAEGFNGTRGDGFPIAAMLAMVSIENKELVPILTAHIYTVCPTAIPTLPALSSDAGEEELMISLGMLKDKNGDFETFPRFLSRTANVISLVANIMSSNPSSHLLLGGPKGAVEWLSRFLKLLPPAPQSPLPLITAPVLDAFLTGAGHMLANKFPEYFKALLDKIVNDVVNRLDEGEIGKPSSIRLKKTIKDGFEGFEKNLPSRALAELYFGADPSKAHPSSFQPPPPSSSTTTNNASNAVPNPFGGPANPTANAGNRMNAPNPFGGSTNDNTGGVRTNAPNPFGGGGGNNSNANNNPFGSSGQNSNPFGSNNLGNSMQTGSISNNNNNNPFGGGGGGSMSNSSPFGSTTPAFGSGSGSTGMSISSGPSSNNNVFGPSSSNPSPFGGGGGMSNSSPFGSSNLGNSMGGSAIQAGPSGNNNNNPFGGGNGGGSGMSNPSPFGSTNTTPAFGGPAPSSGFGGGGMANVSPFGGGSGGMSNPSPFGGGGMSNPSPFGGGGMAAPAPSPFSSSQNNNNNSSAFGGGFGSGGGNNNKSKKPPCKFFAKGHCKFGNNCKFSHESGGGGGGGTNSGFGFNNNAGFRPRR